MTPDDHDLRNKSEHQMIEYATRMRKRAEGAEAVIASVREKCEWWVQRSSDALEEDPDNGFHRVQRDVANAVLKRLDGST